MPEPFWRLLPNVRLRERTRFLFFLSLIFLITVAETVGLAGSESLFLARVGFVHLPLAFVGASLAALVGSFAYASVVGTYRNDRLFVVLLLAATGLLGVCGVGAWQGLGWAFPLLFCLFWVNRVVFLHFWTFAGDHFDTMAGKRLFPLFAAGSSLGGMAGGVVAAVLGRAVGAEWLVAGWMVLLLGAAALLVSQLDQLRRWIPMERMEADDTSVENLRGANRYLRRTPLGRWLIASCLGMVVALFAAQYVYLGIFAREFPEADDLALFFGIYLAVANLVEVVVETAVSRWLIPRFGVPTANLIHPVLTLLSFLGLILSQRLPVAVLARANRELLENALASPLRNLTYNALPDRYRGRVRGFIEGVVMNGGMAGAGLMLLALGGHATLLSVSLLGAGASILYGVANLRVRREYLRALVEELRAGRLDLRELEGEIGGREVASLAELWAAFLEDESPPQARMARRVAETLAHHGLTAPLLAALSHRHGSLRRASLETLMGGTSPEAERALAAALTDPEAGIRLAALGVLAGDPQRRGSFETEIRACLAHQDPGLRAQAAAALGDEGLAVLEDMLGDGAVAALALQALPDAQLPWALPRAQDPTPEIRAAALERLAEVPTPPQPALDAAQAGLDHPDARVRMAAVRVLARGNGRESAPALGERLADASREVRRLAAEALLQLGERGIAQARSRLASDSTPEAQAALGVLGGLGTAEALAALRQEYRRRMHRTWGALFSMRRIPEEGPLGLRFLRLAFEDALRCNGRLAFLLLEQLEDPGVVRSLEKVLRFSSDRLRADALEVLTHLGDREASQLLVSLLEEGPLEERCAQAASLVGEPQDLDEVLEAAPGYGRWVRTACAALDGVPSTQSSEVAMERLLTLRRVPLFSQLTLEQIEAVDELMREGHYMEGEVVCREGDAGDELFVVLEGEIEFYKQAGETRLHLSTLSAGTYFGEMAILSDEPRSATAVASRPSRLLGLRGDRLKELILEMPEISFEIFRVLTSRVKAAEDRLEERGGA